MKLFFRIITLSLTTLLFFQCSPQLPKDGKPKNIILLIGDGMGPQAVAMVETYAHQAPHSFVPQHSLAIERLMNAGVTGNMTTYPKNAMVVDSAASATQIATGKMSASEMIGLDYNGNPAKTILEMARDKGLSTGLVSDTRLTHATPAAFAAHKAHRSMENEIAVDMLNSGADVMLSGGWRHFLPADPKREKFSREMQILLPPGKLKSKRKDDLNLVERAREKGYNVVFDRAHMFGVNDGKLLGLFSESGMPDAIQMRREKNQTVRRYPTLAEMSSKALSILSKNDSGFFLMIEAGQIDWAEHNNDAGRLLQQMLEFDETIELAMNFAETRGDTLVILTADHETGGPNFSYSRKNLPKEKKLPGEMFRNILFKPNFNFGDPEILDKMYAQKQSFDDLFEEFDALPENQQTPATLQRMVNAISEFSITVEEAARVLETEPNNYRVENHKYLAHEEYPRIDDFEGFYVYGEETRMAILARVLAGEQSFVWSTGTHTNTPVPLVAYGPGSKPFSGIHHSTEVAQLMQKILDVR